MGKVKDWMVDYLHLAKGALLMYWHEVPPQHYLGHIVAGKNPVIIIPGIALRWGFLKPLADAISLEGHPTYVIPNLGYNLKNIPLSARMVGDLITEHNLHDVILVAHSKGGIIGKYLMSHGHHDIAGMIAIATPFSGSKLSGLIPHASYRELTQSSGIIQELQHDTTANKRIVSIMPEYDNHVWAKTNSFLEGAKENIVVPIRGHHAVLYDKRVWHEVLAAIQTLKRNT